MELNGSEDDPADGTSRKLEILRAISEKLRVARFGATSESGVKATVDGHGKLLKLEVTDATIRKSDTRRLEEEIVIVINAARQKAESRREKISSRIDPKFDEEAL